jgi:hypothetical protein
MAQSICPKCSCTKFELQKFNAPFFKEKENHVAPYWFVQCEHCGCVVGIIEDHSNGYYAQKIADKIGADLETNNQYIR